MRVTVRLLTSIEPILVFHVPGVWVTTAMLSLMLRNNVKVAFFFAFAAASLVTAVAVHLVLTGQFLVLPPNPLFTPQSFASKLEFTARYWILGGIWILFSMCHVMLKRMFSGFDPLSGSETLIAKSNNILRNSIEQLFLSIIVQVSAITYFSGEEVLRCIPIVNAMYFVGRIAFWFGYPKYRTFGFCLTIFPTTLLCMYSVYKFAVMHLNVSMSFAS